MIFTDGEKSIFGVYRTILRGKKKPYIDFNLHSERVGSFQFDNGKFPNSQDYKLMSESYATEEYPAYWFES